MARCGNNPPSLFRGFSGTYRKNIDFHHASFESKLDVGGSLFSSGFRILNNPALGNSETKALDIRALTG